MTITGRSICRDNSDCDNNGEVYMQCNSYCDNNGEVYMARVDGTYILNIII